jgi:hypothetical protein
MKRTHLSATILAAALGVSVAAQSQAPQTGQAPSTPPTQGTTPAQPTTPQQPPSPTQPTPATGTAPTAPAPQGTSGQIQQPVPGTQGNRPITITGCLTPIPGAASGGYTLNNITGGESNSPSAYTLVGGDRALMGTYGNSRVEVSGTLASPVGNGNAVGTTGRGSSSAAAPPSSPAAPAGSVARGAAGSPVGAATGTAAGGGVPTASGAGTAAPASGAAGSILTGAAGAAPPPPNFAVTTIRQVPGSCGGR